MGRVGTRPRPMSAPYQQSLLGGNCLVATVANYSLFPSSCQLSLCDTLVLVLFTDFVWKVCQKLQIVHGYLLIHSIWWQSVAAPGGCGAFAPQNFSCPPSLPPPNFLWNQEKMGQLSVKSWKNGHFPVQSGQNRCVFEGLTPLKWSKPWIF